MCLLHFVVVFFHYLVALYRCCYRLRFIKMNIKGLMAGDMSVEGMEGAAHAAGMFIADVGSCWRHYVSHCRRRRRRRTIHTHTDVGVGGVRGSAMTSYRSLAPHSQGQTQRERERERETADTQRLRIDDTIRYE